MTYKKPTPRINKLFISFQIQRFAFIYYIFALIHLSFIFQEDPKLWYGIGILYDRYGSLDHAEEAFSSVLRMDKGLNLFVILN